MAKNKIDKFLVQNRKEFTDNFWRGLGDTTQIKIENQFLSAEHPFKDNPIAYIIDLMRRPENFSWTCNILFDLRIPPFQHVVLNQLWNHTRPILIATRGGAKSYSLALYALLLCLFKQNSRVVVTGAAFRQAKLIFEYAEGIWRNAPMFQDILSDDRMNKPTRDIDRCVFRIGRSTIVAIPTGNGEKIRGLRSSCLICDEFDSIDTEVFEQVMQGFGAVNANPVESMVWQSKLDALKILGEISEENYQSEVNAAEGNQCIISGTCGYTWNPLYRYYSNYKKIIESGGNIEKLEDIFNGKVPPRFNHKDYCTIRLPYDLIPRGFMEEKTIGHSQANTNNAIFQAEYGTVFISDSNGFYKRSLIEHCVCGKRDSAIVKNGTEIKFSAMLRGNPGIEYIFGIDPASEVDNFCIVILETWPDHRRVVHCWTINKKRFHARLKKGLTEEHDFYNYCCRKVRALMKIFPCKRICIDTQGGGNEIMQNLGDPARCKENEEPIYPIIDSDKPAITDGFPGKHIIFPFNFSDAALVSEANHGLKHDMEQQSIVFPHCNAAVYALAFEEDKMSGRLKEDSDNSTVERLEDTFEDVILEVEDIKNELVLIEHNQTNSGRDQWNTPETKNNIGKKGRLRKDRYSALLMANNVARNLIKTNPEPDYHAGGGFAKDVYQQSKKQVVRGQLYQGPEWFTDKVSGSYGALVKRKV